MALPRTISISLDFHPTVAFNFGEFPPPPRFLSYYLSYCGLLGKPQPCERLPHSPTGWIHLLFSGNAWKIQVHARIIDHQLLVGTLLPGRTTEGIIQSLFQPLALSISDPGSHKNGSTGPNRTFSISKFSMISKSFSSAMGHGLSYSYV
jgi:hypothetical protein